MGRRVEIFALVGVFSIACTSGRPNFGTLPRVEIPLGTAPAPEEPVAAPAAGGAAALVTTDQPDPPPLSTRHQIDMVVQFDRGEVTLKSFERVELRHAAPSPRTLGRFALELWIGSTLIERVRFDFPLLGASLASEQDVLENGLNTQVKVRVPVSPRANRAQILDRKTRKIVEIPWPLPQEEQSPAS